MQAAPQFLRSIQTPRLLMLLYHRINDTELDPQVLSVKPAHFEEHLQVLRKKYRSLNCSVLDLDKEAFSTNSVVVTFDDGYADNVTGALPLLNKYAVPATVFISTGMVEQRTAFWWSELASIVFGAHVLPNRLKLDLRETREWVLAESSAQQYASNGASAGIDSPLGGWNLLSNHDPAPRHEIYREVSLFLRGATEPERARVLGELRSQAGLNSPAAPCESLTGDQIVKLSKSGLIELGSHTVSHPVLSNISRADQMYELSESKKFLEDLVGHSIEGFAYPYGTRADYTAETVSIARQLSYQFACSNIPEAIWPGTDRFQLPRLLVRDCDGDYFERWLAEWFGER